MPDPLDENSLILAGEQARAGVLLTTGPEGLVTQPVGSPGLPHLRGAWLPLAGKMWAPGSPVFRQTSRIRDGGAGRVG